MAVLKPCTGDSPLEVEWEGRGIAVRIPVDGGGRLVSGLKDTEAFELKDALAVVER